MGPGTINIVVLHAQSPGREALCDFLSDQVGLRVVGGTGLAPEVPDLLRAAVVHVLIVHHTSLGEDAADLIDAARLVSPGSGVLLLTSSEAGGLPQGLLLPGAAAVIAETQVEDELVGALRTIAMGRRYRPQANRDAA